MVGIITIDVIALNATTATQIIPRNKDIVNYSIVPITAVTVWIGASENVTKTTGYPCLQTLPFPSAPNLVVTGMPVFAIADSATPSVAVYIERIRP